MVADHGGAALDGCGANLLHQLAVGATVQRVVHCALLALEQLRQRFHFSLLHCLYSVHLFIIFVAFSKSESVTILVIIFTNSKKFEENFIGNGENYSTD